MRAMLSLGAFVGATALAGCAGDPALADRVVENTGAEAFFDQVGENCGKLSVGSQQLDYLLGMSSDDTYFVDETSKLYFGRVGREAYSTDINAFYPGGNNQLALDCVFEQLTNYTDRK
jgi:hypothetical protein